MESGSDGGVQGLASEDMGAFWPERPLCKAGSRPRGHCVLQARQVRVGYR